MKRGMGVFFAVVVLALISPILAIGGNGKGVMDGTGPAPKNDVLEGVPFSYSGVVMGCNDNQGLVLYVTEAEESFSVAVSGIGPQRYWDLKDMEKPCAGDKITVTGYTITRDDLELNIAFKIIFEDGSEIELRDPVTGLPLWRQAKLKINKKGCEE
jgi:hypothetical protein